MITPFKPENVKLFTQVYAKWKVCQSSKNVHSTRQFLTELTMLHHMTDERVTISQHQTVIN